MKKRPLEGDNPSGGVGNSCTCMFLVGRCRLFLLFQLFNANANELQRGGRTAGISVLKAKIVNFLQKFLVHNDGVAWFLRGHSYHLLTVHIMRRFIGSVKRNLFPKKCLTGSEPMNYNADRFRRSDVLTGRRYVA